jgi:hypothetical protein
MAAFRLLELCFHSRGAGLNTNGQYHGDWVSEPGQIDACALRLERETVVAEGHNLHLQAHAVDSPLKTQIFRWDSALNEPGGIVTEKVPIWRVTFSVTGLIPFLPRVKDSFRSKPGGGPAAISSFAKDEAKAYQSANLGTPFQRINRYVRQRLYRSSQRVIATDLGFPPVGKGGLAMGVSAPVLGLIVYPQTVPGDLN